ncbi:acyl-CoA thioesterase [Microbacterium sp. BH-3-3-3]|uniref:acyl-CoA thioesterase n=1 Tax=Microbacterium sp. BH-3-3-3 TaxID=1906742 RepID=UPI0011A3414C|nr:acyl-CoA thioesterase [Microbacterium sp. BH-3-3-3]
MNVLWRTLLVLARARRRLRREGPIDPSTVTRMRIRVLPTDVDLLRHMNNGRYLSLFDLGRWDLLTRSGLVEAMTKQGWYAVVAAETITFRRSLELGQRFDLETRMIGHDDRAVYLEHRALVRGEIYARAIIRARILRRTGGTVPHDELFAAVGRPEGLPDIESWVHDWAAGSALPSTKRPAPSVWE